MGNKLKKICFISFPFVYAIVLALKLPDFVVHFFEIDYYTHSYFTFAIYTTLIVGFIVLGGFFTGYAISKLFPSKVGNIISKLLIIVILAVVIYINTLIPNYYIYFYFPNWLNHAVISALVIWFTIPIIMPMAYEGEVQEQLIIVSIFVGALFLFLTLLFYVEIIANYYSAFLGIILALLTYGIAFGGIIFAVVEYFKTFGKIINNR